MFALSNPKISSLIFPQGSVLIFSSRLQIKGYFDYCKSEGIIQSFTFSEVLKAGVEKSSKEARESDVVSCIVIFTPNYPNKSETKAIKACFRRAEFFSNAQDSAFKTLGLEENHRQLAS